MKNKRSNILRPISQTLRKNMTPEEKHLWYDFLKKLPFTVRRQMVIEDYIVDFYIAGAKTVIEIDGKQHSMKEHKLSDEIRDKRLLELGINVLRYSNYSINHNFNSVCSDIMKKIGISVFDLKK